MLGAVSKYAEMGGLISISKFFFGGTHAQLLSILAIKGSLFCIMSYTSYIHRLVFAHAPLNKYFTDFFFPSMHLFHCCNE